MDKGEQVQGERGGNSRNVTPTGVEALGPKRQVPLPVWFFVGLIFVVYGVIILVTGFAEVSHPPHTELWQLRPAIWWGAVILVVGAFFVSRHGRRK
jgi:hypothetical protein